MSLVVKSGPAQGPDLPAAAEPRLPAETEYHFLLGRFIDAATLARANALAAQWGVHPHDVLIANGWLDESDYYRALADHCGTPFKESLLQPGEAALPAKATPRQCLANGLLKERARSRRFVLAPDRLRPNALRAMLAQLAPYGFALATPRAVREAVYHHFAPALARGAVEALAARRPDQSAWQGAARWQRLAFAFGGAGLCGAFLLAPVETLHTLTLLLAVLFVPVIGLRAAAAYGLLRGEKAGAPQPREHVSDAALPTYTILAPLYREAHMLPSLVRALLSLDYELLGGSILQRPGSVLGLPFWGIAWFDLVAGYLAAMVLALLAVRRRKLSGLSWQVLLMPLYWLMISGVAYRAVWQFMTAPFKWDRARTGADLLSSKWVKWSG